MQAFFRHRVSVIVIHRNQILGFHAEDSVKKVNYFFLPGGEIENGESVVQTATRETLEETGYSIEIRPDMEEVREYDFEWFGKLFHCRTHYLVGVLKSTDSVAVEDASYHRGVGWVDLDQIENVFSYHQDILEPIQKLVAIEKARS